MKLTDLISSAEELLALEPEELAGILIELLNTRPSYMEQPVSRRIIGHIDTVKEYPELDRKACQSALMEAWSVLEREGLIVHHPEHDEHFYIITRRGSLIKNRNDFVSFKHSQLFPKSAIHPEIVSKGYPLYLRGDYETAIFQAFKSVEVKVRNACPHLGVKLYGTDLMRKAFHSENGPLTNLSEPTAERDALSNLFAGAIGRFKNPSSHRHVPITSATETIEALQFASHLLRLVDDRIQDGEL